jgi:hypothetical protein
MMTCCEVVQHRFAEGKVLMTIAGWSLISGFVKYMKFINLEWLIFSDLLLFFSFFYK